MALLVMLFGAVLALGWTAQPAWAQSSPSEADACKAILAAAAPKAPSLASSLTKTELAHCDEQALYYGFGKPADYRATLACGWWQLAHPRPSVGDPFYGAGVLSMLYANGQGAPRNLKLARRFVCANGWAAPAEIAGRLEHLAKIEAGAKASFDLCDDATSGLSQGACEQVQQRRQQSSDAAALAALRARLPEQAQAMFPELEAAEKQFEHARIANEIDLSGSGRAAFQLADEGRLRDQFLINLRRFTAGSASAADKRERLKAGAALDGEFAAIENAPEARWRFGTVRPEGVRRSQAAWQRLFAVWMRFAPVAYPRLSPDAVATELLRLRTHQLKALLPPA